MRKYLLCLGLFGSGFLCAETFAKPALTELCYNLEHTQSKTTEAQKTDRTKRSKRLKYQKQSFKNPPKPNFAGGDGTAEILIIAGLIALILTGGVLLGVGLGIASFGLLLAAIAIYGVVFLATLFGMIVDIASPPSRGKGILLAIGFFIWAIASMFYGLIAAIVGAIVGLTWVWITGASVFVAFLLLIIFLGRSL